MTLEERAALIRNQAQVLPSYPQAVYAVALQHLREVQREAQELGWQKCDDWRNGN